MPPLKNACHTISCFSWKNFSAALISAFTPALTQSFATRDEQEVARYADVMETLFNAWQDLTLTENQIKQLHRDLLRYSAKDDRHRGEYKTANRAKRVRVLVSILNHQRRRQASCC